MLLEELVKVVASRPQPLPNEDKLDSALNIMNATLDGTDESAKFAERGNKTDDEEPQVREGQREGKEGRREGGTEGMITADREEREREGRGGASERVI